MDANRYSSLKFSIIDVLFPSFVKFLPQLKCSAKYGLVYQLLSQSLRMWVYMFQFPIYCIQLQKFKYV